MKNRKPALGVMLDVSRNAVMTMEHMKDFLRDIAKMGYNCMFLYAENTYEVEGELYFGYMRGKYSKEQMREMDAYAKTLGIEVIPCIQTLAHLTSLSKWGQYAMDTDDILMVDDNSTYVLIEKMFKTLSECFTTKKLHVGMDEAHMLGRGRHLDKYGYETVDVLMKRHLARVCEIAKKYGYDLMIWSDMYFRPWNNGAYSIEKKEMPQEYVEALPENVIPVYWDYYSDRYENYDDMFYNHKQLSSKTWFAGGAWSWGGFAPHNSFSMKCTPPAIAAAKKYGVRDIFITMWGDDGAECSRYSLLPCLFFISEHVKGNTDIEKIKAKFKRRFGLSFDEFMLLDSPNVIAEPARIGHPVCPSKYMLYADPFLGFPDSTVKVGEGEKYVTYAAELRAVAKKSRKYGYIFDTLSKLCTVLADKYELGVKTRAAYKAGDKIELARLANEEYTRVEKNLKVFIAAFERQWMKENKPQGFEVQHERLGGLLYRMGYCKKVLLQYAAGKVDAIPELEEDILTYKKDHESIYLNAHAATYTSSVV